MRGPQLKKIKIVLLGRDPWVDLLVGALEDLGCELARLESSPDLGARNLWQRVLALSPDLTLCRNNYFFTSNPHLSFEAGLELKALLEESGILHVAWQLDNPAISGSLRLLKLWGEGYRPKNTLFAVTDRHHLDFFKRHEVSAFFLPMAIDARLEHFDFSPATLKKHEHGIVFVGTPPPYHEPPKPFQDAKEIPDFFSFHEMQQLIKSCENIPSFAGDESARQKIFAAFRNFFGGFFCEVQDYEKALKKIFEELSAATGLVCESNQGFMDLKYSYAQLLKTVLDFIPESIAVFGGESWRSFLGDYQSSYPRVDFAHDLPHLFRASKVILCVTKWQYRTAVHDRPLMVLACGGFPLTDYRQDLDLSFEAGEIISYKSLEEAHDLAGFYLKNESARQDVINKGRRRVFERHSYHERARVFLQNIQSHFGI